MKYVDPEIRRNLLARRLVLTILGVAIFYLVLYFFFGYKSIAIPLVMPFVVMSLVVYGMLSYGWYVSAKVVGLVVFNMGLFFVASSESTSSGVYLHFVTCTAGAIAMFRYEQRWISLSFSALSMILFLSVNLLSFDFIPHRTYPPDLTKLLFFIHTSVVTFTSIYCIMLIMGMNFDAERHLNEKQAIIEKQNEELKKTNEELDRFVYSASHDLRAPLTGIGGLINLMEIDKETPPDLILDKMKSQIRRMESFITDIVHYSRNSRLEVKPENIKLKLLVDEVFKSLLHFEHGLKIVFENHVPSDIEVVTDRHRLTVIITNLVGNAVRYSDLKKEKSVVSVNFSRNIERQVISVRDNGIGIEKQHLSKIFEMFYRASSGSRGSGLGLYIVSESLKKLGYRIEVDSELGVGSTFSVLMPA
jgi:signal transduction histidine kinase